jgi:hypothetical protein
VRKFIDSHPAIFAAKNLTQYWDFTRLGGTLSHLEKEFPAVLELAGKCPAFPDSTLVELLDSAVFLYHLGISAVIKTSAVHLQVEFFFFIYHCLFLELESRSCSVGSSSCQSEKIERNNFCGSSSTGRSRGIFHVKKNSLKIPYFFFYFILFLLFSETEIYESF